MPTQNPTSKRRVDNDPSATVAATAKRSRVSRACDQCRSAREKCDGQPTCSTCSASKRACTYTTNPKKRGIQPGYIRTLELALTYLFKNSDAEAVLNRKLATEGATSVLLGKDSSSKESNKLHQLWQKSKFCKDIDKLLSGEEIEAGDGRSPHSDNDPDSGSEEPPQNMLVDFSDAIGRGQSTVSMLPGAWAYDASAIEITALPSNHWRLLDVYFAHTHCWFPIGEKHDILRLSYTYPENGLRLSKDMPNGAAHAELWSILAMASIQIKDEQDGLSSIQVYEKARSLIPYEPVDLELGHVKALLILVLVNLTQSAFESAWFLIGHAARMLAAIEQDKIVQMPKFRGPYSACFLLDSIVSFQLGRRPYFSYSDIERVGKIYEDGLEEWQPWIGCLNERPPVTRSRAPVLGLSSFNVLVELIGILNTYDSDINTSNMPQAISSRIEYWKSSLPPTFDYIHHDGVAVPLTPPALLLHIVFSFCCLVLNTSAAWLHRCLDCLEQFRDSLGWSGAPAIINSILESTANHKLSLSMDEGSQSRLQRMKVELAQAWKQDSGENLSMNISVASPAVIHRPESIGALSSRAAGPSMQLPTPESIQVPLPPQYEAPQKRRGDSLLLEDLLPDVNPAATIQRTQSIDSRHPQVDNSFRVPTIEQANPITSRELESFFDELASLDGAEALDNQPQFMQNLGFAPDASMADFLTAPDYGQFNPLMPYVQHGLQAPTHLDQNQFFNDG